MNDNATYTVEGCSTCPAYRPSTPDARVHCFFTEKGHGAPDLEIDEETAEGDVPSGCPLVDSHITLELDAELQEFSR